MDSDSKANVTPETPMTPVRPSFTLHDVAAMWPEQPDPGLGQVTRMMEQIHQLTAPIRGALNVQRMSNTSVTLAMAEQVRAMVSSAHVPIAADMIRIPFVSPTIRNVTGLPAPRPEPVSLLLASARIERALQPIQSESV